MALINPNTGIIGYSDADYAGDKESRKSTGGFVFLVGEGAISWSSKRQAVIAASTMEAEFIAATAAVKEGLWLKQLWITLGFDNTVPHILLDNQAALALMKNPLTSQRAKHIDLVYKLIRERIKLGQITFEYVSTASMLADCLTKGLRAYRVKCARVGVLSCDKLHANALP